MFLQILMGKQQFDSTWFLLLGFTWNTVHCVIARRQPDYIRYNLLSLCSLEFHLPSKQGHGTDTVVASLTVHVPSFQSGSGGGRLQSCWKPDIQLSLDFMQ